jgi:hypothetical protein
MEKHATVLAGLAMVLSILGSLILVIVVMNRCNHPNNWSLGEVIGYPGSLLAGGLVIAFTALVLARVRRT